MSFVFLFFFFKQKTAYEMRISDWSSDVCSSDLSRPIQELASVQGRRIGSRRIARLAPWNDAKVFLLRHGGDPGDRRCAPTRFEIGRASCRERVCQYV